MSVLPERLASVMRGREIGQSELARRVGVGQATISKIISGHSSTSRFLPRIARELGTTQAYLEGEVDDPAEGALPPVDRPPSERLDVVGIQSIDLAYGLGATFVDGPVEVEVLHFPRTWIEAITASPPALLTWTRGRGDSMEPTIHDGDLILIDRAQRVVEEPDLMWAYTVGEFGAIKRLRVKGSKVQIHSDNQSVRVDEEPIDTINIVGRVVFVGKRK